jgi:hypothetical protein
VSRSASWPCDTPSGGWPEYAALFSHVYDAIKADAPATQIGAEFVLQSLMHHGVGPLVKSVVDKSDYLGLSFYPYGSSWGTYFGAPALPAGLDEWRKPLAWVRGYTSKPIAVCETGYITKNLRLESVGLQFSGNPERQASFLRDLLDAAMRDRYAFLVWFVPVDYDRLLAKLKDAGEWKRIWMHAGLFDSDLRPKPAWAVWREFVAAARPATSRRPGTPLTSVLNATTPSPDAIQ